MTKTIKIYDDSWLKAAVIGSIWASFEIIFGSFFHNFRLPFAGTFLTFFSIVLLSAYSLKWDDRYLFLKAGIICALMRSISPTAIIFGPLIGILLEAVIFQFVYNILGKSILTFIVAGILAMFSAIFHKIISILIIYGFDIVKVLENLYYYLIRVTHINLSLKSLLIIIIVLYVLVGILAGVTGWYTGRKVWKKNDDHAKTEIPFETSKSLFTTNQFHYSYTFLFLHFLVIVGGMLLLNFSEIYISVPVIMFYLFFINKRYGKQLNRLKKPVFWFQLFLILILTSLFWNGFNKDSVFDPEGIQTGIKIFFRALLLVAAFSFISIELKNPVIKALLFGKGYSNLYLTSELAVSVLPFLIEKNLSKKIFFNPFNFFINTLRLSDNLLENFKRMLLKKKPVYIITGEVMSGKTTFLKNLITTLLRNQVKVSGIISIGYIQNNTRSHFEIEDINSGKRVLLCDLKPATDKIKTGRFYFYPQALEQGKNFIKNAIQKGEIIIIDEIGPLEMKGSGWFNEIQEAYYSNKIMIWVVRKKLLEKIMSILPMANYKVVDISRNNQKDLLNKISEEIIKETRS